MILYILHYDLNPHDTMWYYIILHAIVRYTVVRDDAIVMKCTNGCSICTAWVGWMWPGAGEGPRGEEGGKAHGAGEFGRAGFSVVLWAVSWRGVWRWGSD